MRPLSAFASAAFLSLMVIGCQQAPARPAALGQEDMSALRAMFDSTVSWVRAANWTAWAGQYSDDALLQPPNAPAVHGRAALLAWGQAFPPVEALDFSNVQVSGEGNLAYGTSDYSMTVQGAPVDVGKQLVVFRKGEDGQWHVVAVSFNSDLPLPGQSTTTTTSMVP